MMKNALACLLVLAVFGVASGCQSNNSNKTSLTGAWRVTERTTTGANGSTNKSPQPGLYLFTSKYYSIVTVNTDQPRPPVPQDATKASAAELNAVYGPFTANSGTYEIEGGMLTTHPLVAKNPNVMAPDSAGTSSVQMDGNTLTLTGVKNSRGPVANPTTLKLTRVE